jgi:hypothetical protein
MSWVLRFRLNNKAMKYTLGRYDGATGAADDPQIGDALSLADAHKLAIDAKHKVGRGIDPTQEKRRRKDATALAAASTFRAVAERYFRDKCGMQVKPDGSVSFDGTKRSAAEQWRVLTRQVFPHLGDRAFDTIDKDTVRELLKKLSEGRLRNDRDEIIRGGPVAANRCLAAIRGVLMWKEEQSNSYRAPSFRGLKRTEKARERSLSDGELRVIWKVASAAVTPFDSLVRFLLLTCARRVEASAMRRGEVTEIVRSREDDHRRTEKVVLWTLPASRNKAGVDFIRPLSRAAVDLLAALPVIADSKFFFTLDGTHPVSSFSRLKREFDARVLAELKRQDPQARPLPRWTLHDLRRSGRSLLSRAHVLPDNAERCLGHVIGGVRGTYDVHDYFDQKRDALNRLAHLIEQIVAAEEGNNIALLVKPSA